jgi:hypothetical protein
MEFNLKLKRPLMKFTGCVAIFILASFNPVHGQELGTKFSPDVSEHLYLQTIRDDFNAHRENISLIHDIGMNIVARIDSLFAEQRADTANTDLIRGIMVTRQYDRTIMAHSDILNGSYISDPELKLIIARHTALFEGYANAKREWDNQWDITARPYIYKHGLLSNPGMFGSGDEPKQYNLYRDPEFRTILWDRRMFAFDVTYTTPALLESVDAVIKRIDELLISD